MKTPVQSILLVLLASFIGSFGAVFLKMGAGKLHRKILSLLLNWRLAAGVALYLLSFVFYYLGVRQGELSVLFPMVAVGYIWTMVWSRIFFGEPVTRRKVGGLALIICGMILLNLGNR
ncbi:MAG: EamA family transporter [Candidatus Solibacter usitatus]|nr:EamA family transporter [Candidatus Solibacter usitatus]